MLDTPGLGQAAPEAVVWKSYIGVHPSSNKVKSAAKGWGRSGALTEPLITRHGSIDGFLATIASANTSLFIGFTSIKDSLQSSGRVHQDDLDFSIRISADGTISYQSRAKLMQYYHVALSEADSIGVLEKGDAVGMRLTHDRKGFALLLRTKADAHDAAAAAAAAAAATATAAAAASTGDTNATAGPPTPTTTRARESYRVVKTVSEVISFPLRLLLVFGGCGIVGPVSWLKSKVADGALAGPSSLQACVEPLAVTASSAQGSDRVVKGRTAADLLGVGTTMDFESGRVLVMKAAEEGSWASGRVKMLKDEADPAQLKRPHDSMAPPSALLEQACVTCPPPPHPPPTPHPPTPDPHPPHPTH